MNGGKETWGSLGRNKTAQFSLTEWLSNCLTQWKRSQNITAKYLWNKMYNNAGTWHEVQAHYKGPYISDLTELKHGSADARQDRNWKTMIDLYRRKYDCLSISNMYVCMHEHDYMYNMPPPLTTVSKAIVLLSSFLFFNVYNFQLKSKEDTKLIFLIPNFLLTYSYQKLYQN